MPGTSTPLTAAQIRAAFKKFGVKYREVPGWETRNRAGHGAWGPVVGFMVHHTGDDAPDTADRNVIINGRTGLPGPLAQFGGNDDDTIDLIGLGRANHAGTGDPDVLAAVRDESYANYPPQPNQKTVDGNGRFYGLETYYSGKTRPKQYASMVNLAAAICDAHGWTGKSVIGHKEWSYTKPDPGSVDMAQFRRDVDARIKAVNSGTPSKPTAPTPDPSLGGLTMADINTLTEQLARIEGKLDAVKVDVSDDLTKADGATLRNDLAWQNRQAAALAGQVAGLSTALTSLAAGQGVDLDAVAAAAKAGAQAALDEKIAGAVTQLNVTP
ncbi:MAG: N-acetylmuramoyl-L-alanine amidase [Hamadaea sp.]|nr:N-acetylmuramoyl-L-alanine amidase [Hamadaea sp.]NUO90625.1 N-acetylmuramoyl-L-alanine amidase [Dermatophilaceae bacterium]